MTSVNYPTPVLVNGYSCRNCTDVANAKKNIDPQHPKDGPFGVDKAQDTDKANSKPGASQSPAVVFGGQLAGAVQPAGPSQDTAAPQPSRVDIKV